jgi:hypothetical protein
MPDTDKYMDELEKFFQTLRTVVNDRLKSVEIHRGKEKLNELSNEVFEHVLGKDALKSFRGAIENYPVDAEAAYNLLFIELEYYNSRYNMGADNTEAPVNETGSIEDGKTVKDSIEEIFNLPNWLKKVLKVLNELLSLLPRPV